MPSRNDCRNDTVPSCPACGRSFAPTGRRQCSAEACRQAGWCRRQLETPAALVLPTPFTREATVYECPSCEAPYIGK